MSTVTFDTLKFAKTLREKAKMTPEQAEGISEAFADATDQQLATKTDIANLRTEMTSLRTELKTDIRETELRLETKIEATKSEILKWMFGQTLVILGVLIALLRFGH